MLRGYDERTVSGSLGLVGTQEFRTPAISPSAQMSGALPIGTATPTGD